MEGFTPPIIKSIIKKTGSSDLQTTLAYLPTLYNELEIYLRWKKECEETGDNETGDKSDKLKIMRKFNEDNTEKNTDICNYCTKHRPKQAKGHNDASCYLQHPETAPEWWVPMLKPVVKANKAKVEIKTEMDVKHEEEINNLKDLLAEYQSNMNFMASQLQTVNEKDA